ncbi:MAG: UDP-3-O-acyl-N-acetylglucosamine deacetylase [Rhizobiaceae bacterium]|nr:UDP-3-O-acyl-N-acetylglucosamine deacetylase [Rhizobiaceae bacterium]
MIGHQTTLREKLEFSGVGVHSGSPVTMTLVPADANTGILFNVCDPRTGETKDLPANLSTVGATDLCTVLGSPAGAHAATIEHLMAALRALNVDNVIVELDAPEVPVMDGSSAVFVDAIHSVGLKSLAASRCYIRVNKPVRVDMGASWGEFVPYEGTRFEVEIDFDCEAIGRQQFASDLNEDVFCKELSRARTFGFMKDVERLWAAGFALGSSLENSVVIGDDNKIINPEGLRYVDEFVRHKTLDAIGDLALAGAPILGCYRSYRGGHKLNSMVLKALLSDASAFDFVQPARSRPKVMHADLEAVSAPAYAAVFV